MEYSTTPRGIVKISIGMFGFDQKKKKMIEYTTLLCKVMFFPDSDIGTLR